MPRSKGSGGRRRARTAPLPRAKRLKSPAELGGPQYYTRDQKPSVGMPGPRLEEE